VPITEVSIPKRNNAPAIPIILMMESKHVVHNGVLNARMGILIFALNAKTNLNYQ